MEEEFINDTIARADQRRASSRLGFDFSVKRKHAADRYELVELLSIKIIEFRFHIKSETDSSKELNLKTIKFFG